MYSIICECNKSSFHSAIHVMCMHESETFWKNLYQHDPVNIMSAHNSTDISIWLPIQPVFILRCFHRRCKQHTQMCYVNTKSTGYSCWFIRLLHWRQRWRYFFNDMEFLLQVESTSQKVNFRTLSHIGMSLARGVYDPKERMKETNFAYTISKKKIYKRTYANALFCFDDFQTLSARSTSQEETTLQLRCLVSLFFSFFRLLIRISFALSIQLM